MFARPVSRLGLTRLISLIVGGLALAACSTAGGSATIGATDSLKVVATTTVFADLIGNVGGDRISVDSIIPAGAGPEDYEPKPDDARKLADADLIVSNGVGLDDFLGDLIDAAGEESAARLVLGEGLETILVEGEENPHFWLDPSIVADHYVPVIAAKLIELDPAGSGLYEANAGAYAAQIRELDEANKTSIEGIPATNRKLVTFHDAFPYFARHYGFEEVGVILENVGQEPTAAELAALVEEVKAADVRAVFSEAQFSPDLARTLAEEAGISQVVTTLYNDTVGPPPVDTYLKMMEWNVSEIVKALG
jgi:ABC-type Zn uptake system ZnuABC Zn-binding protein ZnuA